MLHPMPYHMIAQIYWAEGRRARASSREYVCRLGGQGRRLLVPWIDRKGCWSSSSRPSRCWGRCGRSRWVQRWTTQEGSHKKTWRCSFSQGQPLWRWLGFRDARRTAPRSCSKCPYQPTLSRLYHALYRDGGRNSQDRTDFICQWLVTEDSLGGKLC